VHPSGHIIGTYSYRSQSSAADRYCVTRRKKERQPADEGANDRNAGTKNRTKRVTVANTIIWRDNAGRTGRRERGRKVTAIITDPDRYRQMKISTRFPELNEEKDKT